jgi:hypothetical protein
MEHVMFDRLVEQFCEFDDFCQSIGTQWAAYLVADGHRPQRQHGPRGGLCDSEIMLLLVLYHSSRFKNFKTFYHGIVLVCCAGISRALLAMSVSSR